MLKIKNLRVGIEKKCLIDNISLEFSPGTMQAILGPNGSGKTTLLKSICGIWPPTSGFIYWNEINLLEATRSFFSKTISYVPQNPHIAFDYTVEEMIEMGRYPHGKSKQLKEEKEKIAYFIHLTHLWPLRKESIMHISSGERQRAYLARALATESAVILLDEPTANLDFYHQREVWHLLKNLAKEQKKIIIIATHDLISAKNHCDAAHLIINGKCAASGKSADVIEDLLHNR